MKKSKHLSNLIKEIVTELDREKPETLSKEFTRYDTNTDVFESGECLDIEIHEETTSQEEHITGSDNHGNERINMMRGKMTKPRKRQELLDN